jgi:23S rRNA pseudouridine1911/1915/1917 synthase
VKDAGILRNELSGAETGWTEPAPVEVLLEDEDILAVNKPAGVVVHPAYQHTGDTLCDSVFARQAARREARPWLLHRLDRDTSGIVLFAKTERARRSMVRQFERHSINKSYLAIANGAVSPEAATIDAPLARDPLDRRRTIADPGGRPAQTRYRVLDTQGHYTLILAEPVTGRTHQIRAHLTHIGAPLAGDVRYLPPDAATIPAPRAMLHAARMRFTHPGTGRECVVIAPLPGDFLTVAGYLGFRDSLNALIQAL